MADTLAKLKVEVAADGIQRTAGDLRSLKGEVAQTGQAASKATPQVGGAGGGGFFGGILGAGAKLGLMTTGIGALAGAVGGLASGLVGGNAAFETYETQFAVLLKGTDSLAVGTERAKERIGDLSKFAANTPFELPEVVKAGKILESFGLQGEKSLKRFGLSTTDVLTVVGDAAAGAGVPFDELSLTFGKFASGATGEAIARLQELGIATKEQMRAVGIEFDKSGALVTPVDEAFKKIVQIVKDSKGGMMDAQSKTFEGMLSNLSDWKDSTVRTLAAPIFDVLKDNLQGLLTWLGSDTVKNGITTFAQFLAGGIKSGIEGIGAVIKTVGPIIGDLARYFTEVVRSGDPLNDWLTHLPGPLQAIVGPIGQVVDFVTRLGGVMAETFNSGNFDGSLEWFQGLPGPLQAIVGVAAQAGDGLRIIVDAVTNLVNAIGEGGNPFDAISAAFAELGVNADPVIYAVQSLVNTFLSFGPLITEGLSTLAPMVGEIFGQIVQQGQERFGVIVEIVGSILGIVTGFFAENGASIVQSVMGWAGQIGQIVQAGLGIVQQVVMTVLNIVRDFMAAHGEEIKGLFTMAWQTIQVVIQGALDIIQGTIIPILQGIAQFISDHSDQITAILDAAWKVISGIVKGAMEVIQGIVKTVTSLIKGDWQGVWDGIKQIVSGVWTAIQGIVQGGVDLVKSIVSLALDALKGIWDTGWKAIQDGFSGVWTFITTELPNKLSEIAADIFNWLSNTAADVVNKAADVGSGIINGIMGALGDLKDRLFNTLRDGITNAIQNVKNFFNIKSPSQYVWDHVGQPIADAIVQPTEDRLKDLSGIVIDGVSGAISAGASAVEGDGALITTALTSLSQSIIAADTDARLLQTSLTSLAESMIAADTDQRLMTESLNSLAQGMVDADTPTKAWLQTNTQIAQAMIDADTNNRMMTESLTSLAESMIAADTGGTVVTQTLTQVAEAMITADTNNRMMTTSLTSLAESMIAADKQGLTKTLADVSTQAKEAGTSLKDNMVDLMGDDPDKSIKAQYKKGLDDMFTHTIIWSNKLLFEQFRPFFTVLNTLFQNVPNTWASEWDTAMQAMVTSTQNMVNQVLSMLLLLSGTTVNTGTTPPGETPVTPPTNTNPGGGAPGGQQPLFYRGRTGTFTSTTPDMAAGGGHRGGYAPAAAVAGNAYYIGGVSVSPPPAVADWLVDVAKHTTTSSRGVDFNRTRRNR